MGIHLINGLFVNNNSKCGPMGRGSGSFGDSHGLWGQKVQLAAIHRLEVQGGRIARYLFGMMSLAQAIAQC